jgi:hypothetical protein
MVGAAGQQKLIDPGLPRLRWPTAPCGARSDAGCWALGIALTDMLGVVLMVLVFCSDPSGRGETAGEPRREPDWKA